MIDYDLALRLKEAGFPQDGEGNFDPTGEKPYPYSPTLKELIEACGEVRMVIQDMGIMAGCRCWFASVSMYGPEKLYFSGNGATVDIAVARLWLALNTQGKGK